MGWAALSELVPYYPLYALLFLDTGLSGVQISVLFGIWSVTGFVCEVPSGACDVVAPDLGTFDELIETGIALPGGSAIDV